MDLRVRAHTVAQVFDAVVRAHGPDVLYVAMNVWTEVCTHCARMARATIADKY